LGSPATSLPGNGAKRVFALDEPAIRNPYFRFFNFFISASLYRTSKRIALMSKMTRTILISMSPPSAKRRASTGLKSRDVLSDARQSRSDRRAYAAADSTAAFGVSNSVTSTNRLGTMTTRSNS
jgi:hypothetical protein